MFYYQYRVVQCDAFMLTTLIDRSGDKLLQAAGGIIPHPVVKAHCERERTGAPGRTRGRCMDSNSPGYASRQGEPERLTDAVHVDVAANPVPWRLGAYRLIRQHPNGWRRSESDRLGSYRTTPRLHCKSDKLDSTRLPSMSSNAPHSTGVRAKSQKPSSRAALRPIVLASC